MSKIVVVTGGSRGIGAATCKLLATQGYKVAVNYRSNQDEAERVATWIHSFGAEAITVQADVSQEAEVIALFDRVSEQLGTPNYLVNNAGILQIQSRLQDITVARFNEILTTNVTSTFLCCKELIRRSNSSGAIVNVSSVAARTGSPFEYIDYAASKGAIDTLTKGLSLELADRGIRVNGVRPGFIHTDMHADGGEPGRVARLAPSIPMKRGGTPEEVAKSIVWLLSDDASYITGTFIDIAGGR